MLDSITIGTNILWDSCFRPVFCQFVH